MSGDELLAWVDGLRVASLPRFQRDGLARALGEMTPDQCQHTLDVLRSVSRFITDMANVVEAMTEPTSEI